MSDVEDTGLSWDGVDIEMADQLSRFSVPGQDPSQPVVDGGTYIAVDPNTGFPGGPVETAVSEDGLTITNRTLLGHLFYNGVVVRRATAEC